MKRLIALLIIISTLLSLISCDTGSSPRLNGVKISKYTIVYDKEGPDYNKRAAEYIRDTIFERSGVELSIVDDSTPEKKNEIVVGETSRPISAELDADTSGFEFAVLSKGSSIALEADLFVIAAAAYYFMETYPMNTGYSGNIPEGVSILEPISERANNFIMLIGDGMGVNQTLLYDHLPDVSGYSDGEDLFYGYMFPYQGMARTSSYTGITDSAAAGTALATGYKTVNGYIGLDKDGNRIKSLTELAAELGKATAVMSTENNTGATPAAFSSHTLSRDNSKEIQRDQLELTTKYQTRIDCLFDYYKADEIPVLEEHISKTLNKMDADDDGFFLMYEEALKHPLSTSKSVMRLSQPSLFGPKDAKRSATSHLRSEK